MTATRQPAAQSLYRRSTRKSTATAFEASTQEKRAQSTTDPRKVQNYDKLTISQLKNSIRMIKASPRTLDQDHWEQDDVDIKVDKQAKSLINVELPNTMVMLARPKQSQTKAEKQTPKENSSSFVPTDDKTKAKQDEAPKRSKDATMSPTGLQFSTINLSNKNK